MDDGDSSTLLAAITQPAGPGRLHVVVVSDYI